MEITVVLRDICNWTLPIKWIRFCLGLTVWLSLIPRPLPDFISQMWRKPGFSPQLWDNIWWPGNEALFVYGHASVRLHYVSWLVVQYSWPLIYLALLTCTEWPDSIVYCKLEWSWPDCGASPQERSWCEPSGEGEASHVSPPWGVASLMSRTHDSVLCITMYEVSIMCLASRLGYKHQDTIWIHQIKVFSFHSQLSKGSCEINIIRLTWWLIETDFLCSCVDVELL